MARFYVGQRVRKTHNLPPSDCKIPPIPCSSEGVIVRIRFGAKGSETKSGAHLPVDIDCSVKFECSPITRSMPFWALEPIVDPGREVIAWSDCVWKPEHLRTEA